MEAIKMEIINCIQGSNEWSRARRGIATASNFSKIITINGSLSKSIDEYAFQLASETITILQDEPFDSFDMQRGRDLEPEARDFYQQETFSLVKQVGFMKCDSYGYSPDGLIGNDGLIEIKCPKQNTHTKYLFNNKLPSEYLAQVQGGLFVSGRKWCDFISYHPNFVDDKKMFKVRVFRDDEFIKHLSKGLNKLNIKKNQILSKIL
jgi:putative phage-type endonuclease